MWSHTSPSRTAPDAGPGDDTLAPQRVPRRRGVGVDDPPSLGRRFLRRNVPSDVPCLAVTILDVYPHFVLCLVVPFVYLGATDLSYPILRIVRHEASPQHNVGRRTPRGQPPPDFRVR